MVTWLCHLFGPLLQNFIQRFHVAKAYIGVSRALDQALNPFVTSSSFSHATRGRQSSEQSIARSTEAKKKSAKGAGLQDVPEHPIGVGSWENCH
jgi:hypothetical protein